MQLNLFARWVTVLVMAVLGIASTGCSIHEEGQGEAVSGAAPSSATAGRPADIDLKDVDPCRLLISGRRAKFGFGHIISRKSHEVLNAPTCTLQVKSLATGTVQITTDARHSYKRWLKKAFPTKDASVSGFSALLVTGGDSGCQAAVDVHDHQELLIVGPNVGGKTDKQACEDVKKYSKTALQTLKGLK